MPDLFDAIEHQEETASPCAPVGIHYNVSYEDYALWDAMNGSTLQWAHVTASHLQAAINGFINIDTRDRKFGRACHCRLLEPKRYHEEFLIASPCVAILKTGDRKGQECGKRGTHLKEDNWYCGTHKPDGAEEPEDYIDQNEAASMEKIAQRLFSHPAANLVRREGGFETSIVWEMQGLKFKARLDKYSPKPVPEKGKRDRPAIITDLKKCQLGKARWDIFGKQAASLGYIAKAALYCDGIKAITGETPIFVWIVIEDKHPHEPAVYQAKQWMLELGRREYQRAINVYKRGLETDDWPGYSTKAEELFVPNWYQEQWSKVVYEP